ncbi:hypothetical protein [Halorhodospira halophila]|uniref:Uncharacterized protein n=1 Tax=Halorhodospira halophila (strain DSM 244 / SL1) TaxID=349124 RepID=A1WZA4_HALHL|nr:hypothetical protein [Halorhodospira halophila]ABM63016.1 conserved hypothetical protein [Halorhodospira halophila SL1]MBK1727863.1 hypothetical protein [Halorhodospira halophila]
MGRRGANHQRDERMRLSLIREAARLMAEDGVRDYFAAKRKAAERLGASNTRNLPGNQEIHDALLEYRAVFGGEEHEAALRHLRQRALEAMSFFADFRPRLVGPVLSGTADTESPVQLHLFADTPETVLMFLMDRRIPFESDERRLRFGRDGWSIQPMFRFLAGDTEVELTVFSEAGLREPPRSEVHGGAMERAGVAEVSALLEEAVGEE